MTKPITAPDASGAALRRTSTISGAAFVPNRDYQSLNADVGAGLVCHPALLGFSGTLYKLERGYKCI
jgi:hypothetical protein